jgi:ABC-type nitrate/sulfonate/bicarbonate transport system substrate-binding protein
MFAPDGAPALSIAKFINDNENFIDDVTVDYNVVSANDIGPKMAQGQADLIVMPINAASKLYKANASDPYKMVSVVTHGNLFLMSSEPTDLNGLKGKVVGVIGQGLVPDLTFRSVLKAHDLLDFVQVGEAPVEGKIVLRYFNDAPSMLPLLKQGVLSIGLLPEPAATNLTKVASNREWTRMDVQELYDATSKSYPQAVLMVKKSVYQAYKDNIDAMSDKFSANITWVKENTALAVEAVNSVLSEGVTASLVATNITSTVVDNCKIYFEKATDAKTAVNDYINKIIAINEQSAKAVSDDFFA